MLVSVVTLLASAGLAAGWATDAKTKGDNPPGAQYCVRMTPEKYNGLDLAAVAETGNDGFTHITININGALYPTSDGPFLYHVHQNKVSSATDCAAAGGHLDPYNRGDTPACDSSSPETCQVGDLSGKHGSIESLPGFSQTYGDQYLSLKQGDESFIGDKSLVLHFANLTRFACANFGACQTASASGSQTGSKLSAPPSSNSGIGSGGDPILTTITSTITSGQPNGSVITLTKTVTVGNSTGNAGGSLPDIGSTGSPSLTTITSTINSGASSGRIVTVTTTVSGPGASTPPVIVSSANGRLTTITSTTSAQITATLVSTLPGPSLTTITSTYMTLTAIQLVATYTSTLSDPSATNSLTTVTSTSSPPSLTTITSTLSPGSSLTTITSSLSYTTVTSTSSNDGSTSTTTWTSQVGGGLLDISVSIGNPLNIGKTGSPSSSTTTTTETRNVAGRQTAQVAQAVGALAVAVAAAVV